MQADSSPSEPPGNDTSDRHWLVLKADVYLIGTQLDFNIRLYDLGRLQITWNTVISYINKLKAQASLENVYFKNQREKKGRKLTEPLCAVLSRSVVSDSVTPRTVAH